MEVEELINKIDAKELKAEAKKQGVKIRCRTKLDIAKDLPKETLEKLAGK
ncbi:MAG: hypothetical protein IBX39_03125 [Candidatus Methanoperedenaceae archaeon]|nr:hypothetical protein [Candidatus Methanoperedenaceae archaeon]MDW7726074.1 hypothetical protein [Candidatus Methanoperedens sp.]